MALSNFTSKLNWRLIFIHLIACCFFVNTGAAFSYLYNPTAESLIIQNNIKELVRTQDAATVVSYIALWTSLGPLIGLLVGAIISFLLAYLKKWGVINPTIVLLIAYLLQRYRLLTNMHWFNHVAYAPGKLFKLPLGEACLLDGMILLAIGILVFFLPVSNKFINRNSKNEVAIA